MAQIIRRSSCVNGCLMDIVNGCLDRCPECNGRILEEGSAGYKGKVLYPREFLDLYVKYFDDDRVTVYYVSDE